MEWKKQNYMVSDDSTIFDGNRIHEMLKTTYWAAERTRAQIDKSLKNSLSLGLFDQSVQIGFARAVTDYSTFSWICDVIIHNDYRNQGLGKWIIQCLVEHPDISSTRMILATKDAQTLYQKYGFARHPFECMVKKEVLDIRV